MPEITLIDYASVYAHFNSPITDLNCGEKCAPYNELGVPFCCDLRHAVPTAYQDEWAYLSKNTDLWREWQPESTHMGQGIRNQTPEGQVLVECLGHLRCRRDFRTITCRAFPFFPYLTREGKLIGFTYYWQYAERCWVINNLDKVTRQFHTEFMVAYDAIFTFNPQERDNFRYHSMIMRRVYGRRHWTIPLIHRNGDYYKVSPASGKLRRVTAADMPKFFPYKIATRLSFPDERE